MSKVIDAVCYFHSYYGLCSHKCKRKQKCPLASAAAVASGTITQQPGFYRIGEERRRTRRDRTKRQWMMLPDLSWLRM